MSLHKGVDNRGTEAPQKFLYELVYDTHFSLNYSTISTWRCSEEWSQVWSWQHKPPPPPPHCEKVIYTHYMRAWIRVLDALSYYERATDKQQLVAKTNNKLTGLALNGSFSSLLGLEQPSLSSSCLQETWVYKGVSTIEATEAAASVISSANLNTQPSPCHVHAMTSLFAD